MASVTSPVIPGISVEHISLPTKPQNEAHAIFHGRMIQHLPDDEKQAILNEKFTPQEESEVRDIMRLHDRETAYHCVKINDQSLKVSRVALGLLAQGKISPSQATTIHMVLAANKELIEEPKVSARYIFPKRMGIAITCNFTLPLSACEEEFKQLQTWISIPQNHYSVGNSKDILSNFFRFSEDEWKEFCSLMEKEDKFEQLYYLIEIPMIGCWSQVYERICEMLTCFHPYTRPNPSVSMFNHEGKMAILPSFTMIQHFFNIRAKSYGRTPVHLRPLFGSINFEDIRQQKVQRESPLGLYCPERLEENRKRKINSEFMEFIDSWHSNGTLSFIYHDLYHLLRELQLSEGQSRARLYCIDLLKAAPSQYCDSLKTGVTDKLVDGDLIFAHANAGEIYVDRKNLPAELFGIIFRRVWFHDEFLNIVITDMVKKKDYWLKEFGIDRSHLEEKEQKLFDEIQAKESGANTI